MILNNCYNYCHYNSSELWIIMKHNTYIYIYHDNNRNHHEHLTCLTLGAFISTSTSSTSLAQNESPQIQGSLCLAWPKKKWIVYNIYMI